MFGLNTKMFFFTFTSLDLFIKMDTALSLHFSHFIKRPNSMAIYRLYCKFSINFKCTNGLLPDDVECENESQTPIDFFYSLTPIKVQLKIEII